MKTRMIKVLVFALLLLAATTFYAGGSPIPWCPIACQPGAASR